MPADRPTGRAQGIRVDSGGFLVARLGGYAERQRRGVHGREFSDSGQRLWGYVLVLINEDRNQKLALALT